jgi:hypothetical protein
VRTANNADRNAANASPTASEMTPTLRATACRVVDPLPRRYPPASNCSWVGPLLCHQAQGALLPLPAPCRLPRHPASHCLRGGGSATPPPPRRHPPAGPLCVTRRGGHHCRPLVHHQVSYMLLYMMGNDARPEQLPLGYLGETSPTSAGALAPHLRQLHLELIRQPACAACSSSACHHSHRLKRKMGPC